MQWVRAKHCKRAIESDEQVVWLSQRYGLAPVPPRDGPVKESPRRHGPRRAQPSSSGMLPFEDSDFMDFDGPPVWTPPARDEGDA